jgi:hypothetical protein
MENGVMDLEEINLRGDRVPPLKGAPLKERKRRLAAWMRHGGGPKASSKGGILRCHKPAPVTLPKLSIQKDKDGG